ncbi:hypothetical protein DSO57_1037370 [Entomophthora muscae]|uniref:Uncharacterized protein n=1 Tax=Entomophthora muscae TaxID=34485 RepID=A0ACC2RDV4_9FUNG|nr:hypothetical protein DSO57_1037370 [Entomophthora muscae]
MALGAFLAGYLPLILNIAPSKLKLFTAFGAGMLIGCALLVIIPEGVQTLIDANKISQSSHLYYANKTSAYEEPSNNGSKEGQLNSSKITGPKVQGPTSSFIFEDPFVEGNSQHRTIGFALMAGFCFMFLIDQIGEGSHSHHIPLISEELGHTPNNVIYLERSHAAIGLLIHAAADGIALGAASVSEQMKVSAVVFFAVALHKAPAAFGLSTFLLNIGIHRPHILRQLVYFSISAPTTAMFTHLLLKLAHLSSFYALQWITGWLLLFSGGTFLYVATMHSLPSIKSQDSKRLSFPEILSIVAGMSILLLLPLD